MPSSGVVRGTLHIEEKSGLFMRNKDLEIASRPAKGFLLGRTIYTQACITQYGNPRRAKGCGQLDLGHQETSTPQFRMLQSVHETFARSVSNALSTFLQSEIQVNLAGTRTHHRRRVPEEPSES